ncbi:hypothetical protein [Vibrio fluvialis]|uniref:hypothetical protein n=1 Tax=Vibrio fluvialis TaxID=676 RepID=UPI003D7DF3C1
MTTADNNSIAVAIDGDDNKIIINSSTIRSALTPLFKKIIDTSDPLELDLDDEYIYIEEVEIKIDYNNLNVYSELIRDNSIYLFIVEEAIEAFDNDNPNYRKRFLKSIKMRYQDVKRDLMLRHKINARNKEDVIGCIKENSDHVISSVRDKLFDECFSNLEFCIESLQMARDMIVCYGFINCKILEVPAK